MEDTQHSSSSWNHVKAEYDIQKYIGEGSYGEVKKAIHRASRYKVAIKRIEIP